MLLRLERLVEQGPSLVDQSPDRGVHARRNPRLGLREQDQERPEVLRGKRRDRVPGTLTRPLTGRECREVRRPPVGRHVDRAALREQLPCRPDLDGDCRGARWHQLPHALGQGRRDLEERAAVRGRARLSFGSAVRESIELGAWRVICGLRFRGRRWCLHLIGTLEAREPDGSRERSVRFAAVSAAGRAGTARPGSRRDPAGTARSRPC